MPSEGDLTVCIRCGAVMMFASDLTVRGMTDAEIDAISSNTECMKDLARLVQGLHFVRSMRN
jgi:hypothetical protein